MAVQRGEKKLSCVVNRKLLWYRAQMYGNVNILALWNGKNDNICVATAQCSHFAGKTILPNN